MTGANDVRRYHGAGTEIGALRHTADEAGESERAEIGGDRRQDVAQDEQAHQAQEKGSPVKPSRRQCHERSSDHHTEGVGSDRIRCRGYVDSKAGGEQLENPHARKLGRPDAEASECQGEQREAPLSPLRLVRAMHLHGSALTTIGFLQHPCLLS